MNAHENREDSTELALKRSIISSLTEQISKWQIFYQI